MQVSWKTLSVLIIEPGLFAVPVPAMTAQACKDGDIWCISSAEITGIEKYSNTDGYEGWQIYVISTQQICDY